MSVSLRRVATLALGMLVVLGGEVGCSPGPKRLWYKPGQRYTMQEFERDKVTCTQGGKLDSECMRARGWVDVSAGTPAPAEPEPKTPPGRSY